jgi:hypothetical protein
VYAVAQVAVCPQFTHTPLTVGMGAQLDQFMKEWRLPRLLEVAEVGREKEREGEREVGREREREGESVRERERRKRECERER